MPLCDTKRTGYKPTGTMSHKLTVMPNKITIWIPIHLQIENYISKRQLAQLDMMY